MEVVRFVLVRELRIVALSVWHPGDRLTNGELGSDAVRGPLILHYHAIGDTPREWDPDNLVIDRDRLVAQLRLIARLGYSFVGLSELVASVRRGARAERTCAVTFDDGTVDNLTALPPIARELGMPVTIYVCPGLAGALHHSIAPEAGVRLMTADELRDLAEIDGFTIGSHTRLHTSLAHADHAQALREMTESKQELEDLTGGPVASFAYPGCQYSPACPGAAREAGYESAVTCARMGSLDPYELRRTSPDRLDGRLTMWLRGRQVYDPLWSSAPGRLARRGLRRRRHGSA